MLSVVVITKDEERNIAACLASLRWVDENIVVDACSTDRMAEIACGDTDRVFVRPWASCGPQKNPGFDETNCNGGRIFEAEVRIADGQREKTAVRCDLNAALRVIIPIGL